MSSDLKAITESSQQLLRELRLFLDRMEPITSRRPLPTGQWYAELQDTCNEVHYLWSKLEILERNVRQEGRSNRP